MEKRAKMSARREEESANCGSERNVLCAIDSSGTWVMITQDRSLKRLSKNGTDVFDSQREQQRVERSITNIKS